MAICAIMAVIDFGVLGIRLDGRFGTLGAIVHCVMWGLLGTFICSRGFGYL